MKFVIGFVVLAISQVHYTYQNCDDVIIRDIPHTKEILVDNKDSPYQLAIDYNSNTLFFSYSNNINNEVFSSAFINLQTNEYNTISGIFRGFSNTVDAKENIVYLGGGDGLYKFDYKTKSATRIEETSYSIWQMFFKNNVYYTTYPNEQVYVFRNDKSELVPELVDTKAMLVALNKNLDFYFTNSSGLFKLNRSNGEILLLGDYNTNAMTADAYGNVYFSTPNGIYFINEKDNIENVASIPDVYGVAIQSDGKIIYASSNEIVRLKPTKSPCYTDKKEKE